MGNWTHIIVKASEPEKFITNFRHYENTLINPFYENSRDYESTIVNMEKLKGGVFISGNEIFEEFVQSGNFLIHFPDVQIIETDTKSSIDLFELLMK